LLFVENGKSVYAAYGTFLLHDKESVSASAFEREGERDGEKGFPSFMLVAFGISLLKRELKSE